MERTVPSKYKSLYNRGLQRKSRKAAVRSFCLECVGYSEKEVIKCTDTGCPLYNYRKNG